MTQQQDTLPSSGMSQDREPPTPLLPTPQREGSSTQQEHRQQKRKETKPAQPEKVQASQVLLQAEPSVPQQLYTVPHRHCVTPQPAPLAARGLGTELCKAETPVAALRSDKALTGTQVQRRVCVLHKNLYSQCALHSMDAHLGLFSLNSSTVLGQFELPPAHNTDVSLVTGTVLAGTCGWRLPCVVTVQKDHL